MPTWSEDKIIDGTATGNDEINSPAAEKPPKGADGDTGTKWLEFKAGGTPFWWQYDFGDEVAWKIAGYRLCTGNDAEGRDPKTWTLQGSNTGAYGGEEEIVDTVEDGALPVGRGVWTDIYICDNPPTTSYRYYRIVISDLKNLAAEVGTQVAEFEMYEDESIVTEKDLHPGASHFQFPYHFSEAGTEGDPGVDGIHFIGIPTPEEYEYIYDLAIFYNDLNYIEGRCNLWTTSNYLVTIGTWLKPEDVTTLKNNIVPGAVGELYQILGKPFFYDKTWESNNTLKYIPILNSQRSGYSKLAYMRGDTVIYVKTYSEHPIENTELIEVKIEGYISSNSV